MKKTLTYCDRCGKVIKVGMNKGSFKLSGCATKTTSEVTTLNYQDLCKECTLKLFFLVDKLMGKEKT